MGTVEEHEKRSQEISDTTRRVAITLNSGGIGLVFTIAGALAMHGNSFSWAVFPVRIFVGGLLFTGISLFFAKHRELRRRDAAKDGKAEPEFKWYSWSFTWDLGAFALFGIGALVSLSFLT